VRTGFTDNYEFVFPSAHGIDLRPLSSPRTLRFEGDVRFLGHAGFMYLGLAEPWIEVRASRMRLSFLHDGGISPPKRVVVAELTWDDPQRYGGEWRTASAKLSAEAVFLFNGSYPTGEPMDSLRIRTIVTDEESSTGLSGSVEEGF
jgi:hypothetical protein